MPNCAVCSVKMHCNFRCKHPTYNAPAEKCPLVYLIRGAEGLAEKLGDKKCPKYRSEEESNAKPK